MRERLREPGRRGWASGFRPCRDGRANSERQAPLEYVPIGSLPGRPPPAHRRSLNRNPSRRSHLHAFQLADACRFSPARFFRCDFAARCHAVVVFHRRRSLWTSLSLPYQRLCCCTKIRWSLSQTATPRRPAAAALATAGRRPRRPSRDPTRADRARRKASRTASCSSRSGP